MSCTPNTGVRLLVLTIHDVDKKILVTALQQAHNWTAKNDRNKMSFWFDVLFDEDAALDDLQDGLGDGSGFRVDVAKTEVQHWLERNSSMCDTARRLLKEYAEKQSQKPPGQLAPISPLAWNWLPAGSVKVRADNPLDTTRVKPEWRPDETDKFEQDKGYGRVSREVDMWWTRARDANFDGWVVPMPSVDFAQTRTENCKTNLVNRYAHQFRPEDQDRPSSHEEGPEPDYVNVEADNHAPNEYTQEYVDDMVEDEDVDDDESYGEGPMTGLLTEVPNILDPKQIEALHMIVKSCILDAAGSGLSLVGENLQKTRCRMFLALDCGKSLLREMLVFIAVWEKEEPSLIFQITSQIVEAIHHSALIPYAWNSLRIPKDIISPAQTVLLKLITYMFRARTKNPPSEESKDHLAVIRIVHFFFSSFRSRIVPECVALMNLQAQIRENVMDPADFPVDNWDMERAKDGLVQFLEFLTVVSEDQDMRAKLIEWEAAYDLLALLKGLEAGVPKKPLVELPNRSHHRPDPSMSTTGSDRHYDGDHPPPPPPPPPMQDPAHKFAWSEIKGTILQILAALLQPAAGRSSPGNPTVQAQIVHHNGIISLLNCCTYDDHNRYARERVQLCLKWLMDGSDEANKFLRDLVAMTPSHQNQQPPPRAPGGGPTIGPTTSLRIDGLQGEVKVQVRSSALPPVPIPAGSSNNAIAGPSNAASALNNFVPPLGQLVPKTRTDELLRDIINLADEAARLALGENGEDTEDEDFL